MVKILKTEVEDVTEEHKTPWLKQWTLYHIEVSYDEAKEIAEKISRAIDCTRTNWYVDFKDANTHYIIFPHRVFHIKRTVEEYRMVREYGISLGLPEYQLDFSSDIN